MSDDMQSNIRNAYAQITQAKHMFESGLNLLSNALNNLEKCEQEILEKGLDISNLEQATFNAHKTCRRPGRSCKLDTDLELRAFVLERIGKLTYPEIADEVALHFPKRRQIGKSSINRWWLKNR